MYFAYVFSWIYRRWTICDRFSYRVEPEQFEEDPEDPEYLPDDEEGEPHLTFEACWTFNSMNYHNIALH